MQTLLKLSTALLTTLFVAAAPAIAEQNSIDIKGIYIGMTKTELTALHPNLIGFTVAGVQNKHRTMPPAYDFKEGKLYYFAFFFDARSFNTVLSAITSKYPHVNCENSPVTTPMGAEYTQTICQVEGPDSVLSVRRFVSNVTTAGLMLASKKMLQERALQGEIDKGDI